MRSYLTLIACISLAVCTGCVSHSPGTLYPTSTAALTPTQLSLRDEMESDVRELSMGIGARNAAESIAGIHAGEGWLIDRLADSGLEARRDEIDLEFASVSNIVVELPGTTVPNQIVLLGAHYDTESGSPGANDNASGVALLLAAARRLRDQRLGRTVRVVFFVNEESPFTFGIQMGSRVYAERCRERGDDIVAMIGVDSVGVYSSEPGSQNYPLFLVGLPETANFLAFASNVENKPLLDKVVEVFQTVGRFPSIGVASNARSYARSDHVPFWWQDYPAIGMSDTSEYRYSQYHTAFDVAANLDYDEMARMGEAFIDMVEVLASSDTVLP